MDRAPARRRGGLSAFTLSVGYLGRMTQRLLIAALLILGGCAPIYVPSSAHVPLLHASGDVHLAGSAGTPGFQLHGAYAFTDQLAARASVQGFAYGDASSIDRGTFFSAGGGPSLYYGGPKTEDGSFAHGFRGSVSLELHGGRSAGEGLIQISTSNTRHRYSGPWIKPMLQADAAYEFEYFSLGLAGRLVGFQYWYDANSDFPGQQMQLGSVEPIAFVRLGTRTVKLEAQAGLMLPFAAEGQAAIPFPILISGGLVVDL